MKGETPIATFHPTRASSSLDADRDNRRPSFAALTCMVIMSVRSYKWDHRAPCSRGVVPDAHGINPTVTKQEEERLDVKHSL